MNIESSQITRSSEVKKISQSTVKNEENDANFSEELDKLKKTEAAEADETKESSQKEESSSEVEEEQALTKNENENENDEMSESDIVDDAIEDLNLVLNKLNQSEVREAELNQKDDINKSLLKNLSVDDDMKNEGEDLINNIDNNDKLTQMNPNMNFGSSEQPFSSFMNNNESNGQNGKKLVSSAKELEEENAILSTTAENLAMANRAAIDEQQVKVVSKNDGIKKVNTETNIVQETIVKYDTVLMNEADVEVFTELVKNGEVNVNNLTSENSAKSVNVSKTLADMLAKSMEDNKPVRIEFDNGISVIIKISRDGKLSADFLPSTQVAEAYLKENLPILKQKFNEQNLDYDELNQRERRNQDREQNRKKGRENE